MRTDTLFYKLLEAQPDLAFRLADLPMPTNVQYRFAAVELKQKAQRPDGVLLPDTNTAPVLVTEVQFQTDRLVYTRIVSETALLLMQYPEYSNVQMVVLLRSRSVDVDARPWQGLLADTTLRVVYLDEYLDEHLQQRTSHGQDVHTPAQQAALLLMQLTVTPQNTAHDARIVQQLQQAVANTTNNALQRLFRDLFVSLFVSKYKTLTLEEVRAMIDTREIFDDIHESLAVQQYAERYAQERKEQGRLEGKIEGKIEGKLEGKLEGVPRLFMLGLSAEQIAEALELPLETVLQCKPR